MRILQGVENNERLKVLDGFIQKFFNGKIWKLRPPEGDSLVVLVADQPREDLAVFRRWIDTYITNWASCDGFCNHTVGDFIEQFPDYVDELKSWTQSDNRWMRRAAAVSLIVPAKHGKFLKESIEIAGLLLTDTDDMVQKGYGWLLKEASRKHTSEVFTYVMKNKKVMPRTALRYAIELMPKELKAEAMKKDW